MPFHPPSAVCKFERMKQSIASTTLAFFLTAATPTVAQNTGTTPEQFWSMLECATLAEYAARDDTNLDRENFLAAHSQLTEAFISSARNALNAASADQDGSRGFSETLPFELALAASGPSVDFIVGRWFEIIASRTIDNIFNVPHYDRSEAEKTDYAQFEFNRQNCASFVDKR